MSCTGGLRMYAAFSSSIKENQAVQSIHEPDIIKSKKNIHPEGMYLHLQPKTYFINHSFKLS